MIWSSSVVVHSSTILFVSFSITCKIAPNTGFPVVISVFDIETLPVAFLFVTVDNTSSSLIVTDVLSIDSKIYLFPICSSEISYLFP